MKRILSKKKPHIHEPEALPDCDGPKLRIFKDHRSSIEWVGRLDNEATPDFQKQAYVFEVKIESQTYALKVFKFFDPDDDKYYWEDIIKDKREVALHTDPFYAECRAYGRIQEEIDRGSLGLNPAVPCFGFLFISDVDKKMLEEKGLTFYDDIELGCDLPSGSDKSRCVRAIVKKLIPSDSGLSNRNLRKIRSDIVELNKLHIYNRDIKEDNLMGGKLVDFGSSYTEPHCYMGGSNEQEAKEIRLGDLVMFDDMVDEKGIISSIRATPNLLYQKKLRSYTQADRRMRAEQAEAFTFILRDTGRQQHTERRRVGKLKKRS